MKKYKIIIEETVSEQFEIEGENQQLAMEKAKEQYNNGEIVLCPGNLISKQIAVVNCNDEIEEWEEF